MILRYETRRVATLDLVQMWQRGHLTPAGDPGAPPWTTRQRVELFDSLERRWPVGCLVAWNPTGVRWRRWYLLDGHRRMDALAELVGEHVGLVRDLDSAQPTYLPTADAVAGGQYLPVNAMLLTTRFLTASRGLSDDALDVANWAAGAVVGTLFEVSTVLGGTPAEVATLCDRLLPGRVQAAALDQIHVGDAAAPDEPPS